MLDKLKDEIKNNQEEFEKFRKENEEFVNDLKKNLNCTHLLTVLPGLPDLKNELGRYEPIVGNAYRMLQENPAKKLSPQATENLKDAIEVWKCTHANSFKLIVSNFAKIDDKLNLFYNTVIEE